MFCARLHCRRASALHTLFACATSAVSFMQRHAADTSHVVFDLCPGYAALAVASDGEQRHGGTASIDGTRARGDRALYHRPALCQARQHLWCLVGNRRPLSAHLFVWMKGL